MEVDVFRRNYHRANLPDFNRALTLKEIIAWALTAVKRFKPKVTWKAPSGMGQLELSFGGDIPTTSKKDERHDPFMTTHIEVLITSLEDLLSTSDLSLWLMIDRLDELFARRSDTEKNALRGLLRTLRLFRSDRIRVKVFLRDDILDEIVFAEGFTALSHLVARKSDTLRWSEEEILTMVVRRIFASEALQEIFDVDLTRLTSSIEYQRHVFYSIFPLTVHRPPNQSATLRWIYNHTKDGRGVVTPRDVIFLLTRACQHQRDVCLRDPEGDTEQLVSGTAIIYGLGELSKEKRTVYLQAEFPHKWPMIKKLMGGGTEYSHSAMKRIFGRRCEDSVEDLVSLGIVERSTNKGVPSYKVPFLYRRGLECTQKFMSI